MGEKIRLKQMAEREERESHIVVDNYRRKVMLWTNNSMVMTRMAEQGVKYQSQDKWEGGIYSRTYEVDFKDMIKIVKVTLYK